MCCFGLQNVATAQIVGVGNNGVTQTNYTNGTLNDDILIWCGAGNNGQLTFTPASGAAPFNFSWFQFSSATFSWTALSASTGATSSIGNLGNGGYRVSVTDANGQNVGCDVVWVWNLDVSLNATISATGCSDATLSCPVPPVSFTYYHPPSPQALIDANTSITVCFTGNHTWVSDLGFYLQGPISCGSPLITLAPNPGSVCNNGNNFNNLCFTTENAPNFNVCNQPTPLSGTFGSYTGTLIDWSGIYGCNAAQSGWSVRVFDCEALDFGVLTNASITFSNLSTDCGSSGTITYDSGVMNSLINDNSCSVTSSSSYIVPPPAALTSPLTISASSVINWTSNGSATISSAASNNASATGAQSGEVFTANVNFQIGSANCSFFDVVTYTNSGPVSPEISYGSDHCIGNGVLNVSLTGTAGGTFSASPAGLSIFPNGNIQLNSSQPGTYLIQYTVASNGCNLSDQVALTILDNPNNLQLSPSSLCEGEAFNGSAQTADLYEYFLNGVSMSSPNVSSTTVSNPLILNDQFCVRGYDTPSFVADGIFNEAFWGVPISSHNANLMSSFGNQNHLDALYVSQDEENIYIGIAGELIAGSNNRIFLFADLSTGGYNSLNSWVNRSNAPYFSMSALNAAIQFDNGFSPEYILAMNTAADGTSYFDLYNMTTNVNQYLGATNSSNDLGYSSAGGTTNNGLGYEMKIPLSAFNDPDGLMKLFVMMVNDPGSNAAPTTLSNQFLTPAADGASNYGSGAVDFNNAEPNPVDYILSDGNCYTETCLVITPSNNLILPTFNPICQNSTNVPALPSSISGIQGTWSPALIDASASGLDFIYTFTPSAGSCTTGGDVLIDITSPIVPAFNLSSVFCQGAVAPLLPNTDGTITGTWNPNVISTSLAATLTPTTYTFTPSANVCATTFSQSVTVTPTQIPTFNFTTSLCQNATAPVLPDISTQGIGGVWNGTVNTDNLGNQNLTFTPNLTNPLFQCPAATTITFTITNGTVATFPAQGPFCSNGAASLPLLSNEGFTGTWSPNSIDFTNTSPAGVTYNFTPDPNQCGANGTVNIVILPEVNPMFTVLGPYCEGQAPASLPLTSTNGINGTWNPSIVQTVNAGTDTYQFTPDVSECASISTMDIVINAPVSTNFNLPNQYCENDVPSLLPLQDVNGVSGTWNPVQINTALAGTQDYTFTPAAAECAVDFTLSIGVNAPTATAFSGIQSTYCLNESASVLPVTDDNGITGTWMPGVVNTSTAGAVPLVFTPDPGQCNNPFNIQIDILPLPSISFVSSWPALTCDETNVDITASGGVSYNWLNSLGNTPTINVQDDAIYQVEVTDANGCMNISGFSVPLDTSTFCVINSTANQLNCSVTQIDLNVVGGASYDWNNGLSTSQSISVTSPGQYTVSVTHDNGCSRLLNITIDQDIALPQVSIINNTGTDTLTCITTNIQLSAQGAASYSWSGGLGNNQLANVSSVGNYTVTGTGTNFCQSDTTYEIFENVVIPVATLSASGNVLDCFIDSVQMVASGGVSYSWNASLQGNSEDSVTTNLPGNYVVTVMGQNGCTDTASWNIQWNRFFPDSNFTYSPQVVMDENATVQLNGPSIPGITYYWILEGDTLYNGDDLEYTFASFVPGDYQVCLIAEYTDLCHSDSCQVITVNESEQLFIPNSFSPGNDGVNDGFYPVFSNYDLIEYYEFSIFNRWGERIFYSTDPKQAWDGGYQNGEGYYLMDGAVPFVLKYKTYKQIDLLTIKGTVVITR